LYGYMAWHGRHVCWAGLEISGKINAKQMVRIRQSSGDAVVEANRTYATHNGRVRVGGKNPGAKAIKRRKTGKWREKIMGRRMRRGREEGRQNNKQDGQQARQWQAGMSGWQKAGNGEEIRIVKVGGRAGVEAE